MKFSKKILNIAPSATVSISAAAKNMKAEGKPVLSFSMGEPDFGSPKAANDAAIDAIKRGEGTILELEDKVGFARRYRAVQEGIESLEQLARDINFYNNNNYAMSEDIHRAADEMLHIINRMSEA